MQLTTAYTEGIGTLDRVAPAKENTALQSSGLLQTHGANKSLTTSTCHPAAEAMDAATVQLMLPVTRCGM